MRPKAGKARIVLWRFLNTRVRGLHLGGSGEPLEVYEQERFTRVVLFRVIILATI